MVNRDIMNDALGRSIRRQLTSQIPDGPHLEFEDLWRAACQRIRLQREPNDDHLSSCFVCQANAFALEQEIFAPVRHRRRVLEYLRSGAQEHRSIVKEIGKLWSKFEGPRLPALEDGKTLLAAGGGERESEDALHLSLKEGELTIKAGSREVRPAVVVCGDDSADDRVLAPSRTVWDKTLKKGEEIVFTGESVALVRRSNTIVIGFAPRFNGTLFGKSVRKILSETANAVEGGQYVDHIQVVDLRSSTQPRRPVEVV